MDSAGSGIEPAFLSFLAGLRADLDQTTSWSELAQMDGWREVRTCVAEHVPVSLRPDLYSRDHGELDDAILLNTSGLDAAMRRAAFKADPSRDRALAADFIRFCTQDAPSSEDWYLLDAELPAETSIQLGDYRLESLSREALLKAHPLPTAAADDSESGPLPPQPLAGAAFLRRAMADRGLAGWLRWGLWLRRTYDRIEKDVWLPLFALLLWSPEITRAEAAFEVEPGRSIAMINGQPSIVPEIAYCGEEEVEYLRHCKQGLVLTQDEIPAFTAFTEAIIERACRVLALNHPGLSKTAKAKSGPQLARRLERAATHVVRAAHRTGGPAGNSSVPDYERHEVVLHYVVAMEALLADDENLDLSRKVIYRAATLFGSDDERRRVAGVVKAAYDVRSKYAHGDDIDNDGALDLNELRLVTRQVLLRWLVLATSQPTGESKLNKTTVPAVLDAALLAGEVRQTLVLQPVRAFFKATAPADPPGDLT